MSRQARAVGVRSKEDGWESRGGYMNAKRQKLQEQFDKEAPNQLKKEGSGSKIFNGISIHVNGYTKPSSDELKRLMMLHGGAYEHYLYRTRVTHVIATNLPISKVRELKGLKVVKPEWITESIAAGRLLNYSNYLLYTAQTGLQTGLRSFSVTDNRDQSAADVTMRKGITSLTSSHSTQSAISKSSSVTTGTSCLSEYSTISNGNVARSNKENSEKMSATKSSDSFSHIDESLNQNSPYMAMRSPDGILTNIPEHMSTSSTSPGKASTASDSNFINEYYNNSRLHYLSTWKAEFKSYVNELQKQGTSYPGRERLRNIVREQNIGGSDDVTFQGKQGKGTRCVMHVDMDCFFVSVGLKNRPDLRGKPVAVTHSKGKSAVQDPESNPTLERELWELKKLNGRRKGKQAARNVQYPDLPEEDTSFPDKSDSEDNDDAVDDETAATVSKATTEPFHSMAEIASCSYEARQRGVKNGMFMGKAKAVCPELVTIPYDFEQYKAVSKILYDTVASYSRDIEAVSCDEMLVDCTELLADTGATPSQFASLLRQEIFNKTGCCASAGLASNVLLAKMATRKAKPNGQFHLQCSTVPEFIKPQSVKDIPGVGWSLTKRLESMKVVTCGDLQRLTLDTLQREFGPKTGQSLYRYCRGEDDRSVKIEQQRKSVSAEVNYGIRFKNDTEACKFIQELSTEVCSRLQAIQMKGKTVTLKLMIRREDAPKQTSKFMGHGICNNFSKSVTLPMPTDDARIVGQECLSILKQQKCVASDLRGIGIQIQRLEPSVVGPAANRKYPSILNFTVNKSISSDKTDTLNHKAEPSQQRTPKKLDVNHPPILQDVQRQGTSNELCLEEQETKDRFHTTTNSRSDHNTLKQNIYQAEHITNSDEFRSNRTDENNLIQVGKYQNSGTAKDVEFSFLNQQDIEETDLYVLSQSGGSKDLVLGEICTDSSDLLQDLGRRQIKSSQLPPLPCLPEIKSPENSLSEFVDVNTPQRSRHQDVHGKKDAMNDDYFPSPSQIDQEVLKELPPEIRMQVEKEIESRRKVNKTASDRQTRSSQGCSHWQQSEGDNSKFVSQPRGGNFGKLPENRGNHSGHIKGNDSEYSSLPREDNHIRDENRRNDVENDIVPLPSPSQVDPEVLKELPPEIRLQVEKEMEHRQKMKNKSERQTKGNNSEHVSKSRGSHYRNFPENRGDHSQHAQDNSAQAESGGNHVSDHIVPLPSSSQLDLSCLNALPESLQNEILQAYARQGQSTVQNQPAMTMMNLKQAKSPQKSPTRKSPAKRSPQFKVPRGRPSTRGGKKGSSKKLVFKDQQKKSSRVVEKNTRSTTLNDPPETSHTNDLRIPSPGNNSTHIELGKTTHETSSLSGSAEVYHDSNNKEGQDMWEPDGNEAIDEGTVNLCAAVKIVEVRSLIKEWVSSTPEPQAEDEEVLLEYIYALVRDKNLEQVDLVLKAMSRNVSKIGNMDWLPSLRRILRETQIIVREYHGHSLRTMIV